ncbi:hypothetical protein L1987_30808 [Smallanthus sonchifolius]|uniref:Uncharacterized protein n=1 Tax=Smallanthus sonchifolius TaxID=185202 RepID=A0ACB9I4G7_9ASTR|nr:hypothetical protein L1987_30808 [Smallanthus sonchifolius]
MQFFLGRRRSLFTTATGRLIAEDLFASQRVSVSMGERSRDQEAMGKETIRSRRWHVRRTWRKQKPLPEGLKGVS